MGKLALAGMISGMGQGLERGVLNLQSGIIQSGLQKERQDWENERLRLTFEHQAALEDLRERRAGEREQRGYEHQEAMTGQQIGSAESIAEQNRTSTAARQQEELAAKKEMQGTELSAKKEDQTEDRKLKREELDITKAHYEREDALRGKYYEALLRAKEGKATAADDKVLMNYGTHIIQPQLQGLNNQKTELLKDTLIDPDMKREFLQAIDEKIAALDADYRQLSALPKRAVASPGGSIKDRFKGTTKPGEAAAAEPPAAPVPPAPPSAGALNQPRGPYIQQELEDLKRTFKPTSKRPAGPSAVPLQP